MSTLKDLNKHLFDQLGRLAKADKDELEIEIDRAQVMVEISAEILKTNKLQLDAVELVAKYKGLSSDQETPVISVGNISIEA